MKERLRSQLKAWQQQLADTTQVVGQRMAALRKRKGADVDAVAEQSDPTANSGKGASREQGPYVPRDKRPAAAAVPPVVKNRQEESRVAEPAEPEVQIGPVELVSGQTIVRPFLVLSVLTISVVFSAISVIFGAYDYRHLFHEHQTLIKARDELQVEWGQLLLEQSAWAANNRVETQAIRRLDMRVPEPGEIEIVRRVD